jgi:hypothetical protein
MYLETEGLELCLSCGGECCAANEDNKLMYSLMSIPIPTQSCTFMLNFWSLGALNPIEWGTLKLAQLSFETQEKTHKKIPLTAVY